MLSQALPNDANQCVGDIQNGFEYKTIPHISLKCITRNAEIDEIWMEYQPKLEKLRKELNLATGLELQEWDILPTDTSPPVDCTSWSQQAKRLREEWISIRIERQNEIDASIKKSTESEILYDQPKKVPNIVRVSGPFTVESLSPYRILPVDTATKEIAVAQAEDDNSSVTSDSFGTRPKSVCEGEDKFIEIVLKYLRTHGIQNTKKNERLKFIEVLPLRKGRYVQFEGHYEENNRAKKVALCIGPEYGTVTRSLLVNAARETADDNFTFLLVLGFAFEPHADDDLINIGNVKIRTGRINDDLRMADRLKTGTTGHSFVMFGDPDIRLDKNEANNCIVEVRGIDIFDPTIGEVKSSNTDDIACWFIDTNYNQETFFVRHAYFPGKGKPPYEHLKKALKAEINEDLWELLRSTKSRPFPIPKTGLIAVKVINHFGEELLKVFPVS